MRDYLTKNNFPNNSSNILFFKSDRISKMNDYSLHYSNLRSDNTNQPNYKVILLFSILILTLTYLVLSKTKIINFPSKPNNPPSNKTTDPTKINPTKNKLIENLEKLIEGKTGSYSIYIYDLNKQKEYSINGQMVITAASVNKLPILASLYYLAGQNEIDLEKIIVPQPSDIQDYGSGIIRGDPAGTPYSIKTLARLMIQKSDNTAAYILGSEIVGLDKIQNLVNTWGLEQTNITENKSSAKDMSILLTKMYRGEITNKPLTLEMLGFLSKTDFEDRIPKGLPSGVKYYHKTGDEINKLHDVAIVDLEGKPYYIGIFTIDITDEESTKQTMSEISKTVYEFMKNL
jgi:beta-lactamase class A